MSEIETAQNSTVNDKSVLDVGCGSAKQPGSWGIDHYPYPGVDQVLDINQTPWDLPADHFDTFYMRHIIEHVASIPNLMNEVHRVAKDGAVVHVVTPHFSSVDSYTDPTHIWHLASGWHTILTDSYLQTQVARFSHVGTHITLGGSMFRFITRGAMNIMGLHWWEKKLAFVLRGRNIETTLRVIKH